MLSRNLKRKSRPKIGTNKKKRVIISVILAFALFFIFYGFYKVNSLKPSDGKKQDVKVETGDRPLKKTTTIYINADGGLSLRKERSSKSERLTLIPNKTQLEASQELDGWYKVSYNGKEGWIAKEYTTTQAPAEDPAKGWTTYSNATYGFKVRYPLGWKYQDYGANPANKSLSLIAFSNQDLPATVPQGSDFIAPVMLQVSSKTIDEANAEYGSISGVTPEKITIAGTPATKYTYTSVSSNTQVTAIVFSVGGKTYIFNEGGGYGEDLVKMANTFSL
ncbi:MAG: SH3 domain-containing protein [Patescibacteria group bacterium]|jgi:hypothetical protein|nr:SH3 domain-containing protein [Patescibacteria group bacterium]